LQHIPLVSEIKRHARQSLVRRLELHQAVDPELFSQVVSLIKEHIVPSIWLHVFAGEAVVESSDCILEDEKAIQMVLDVLAERGYNARVRSLSYFIPGCLFSQIIFSFSSYLT
jgi:hypothetical protein